VESGPPAVPHDYVLVTGAAGFIGRDLVGQLLAGGYRVKAFVRSSRLEELPVAEALAVAPGDLRDRESLLAALDGVGAVAHLAGRKSDEPDSAPVNVEGARHLAEACRRRGVRRIVNVSTQSVKLPRRGVYGTTKAEAEAVLHASGLDVTTLRPSVVYGPDVTGVFARIRDAVMRLPVVPVIGDGRWRFHPIHVRDVSDAVVACLRHDGSIGRIYDLGGPDEVTLDEFVDAVGDLYGIRRRKLHVPVGVGLAAARVLARVMDGPPVTVSNVLGSTQDTRCDSAPARAELGVAPAGLAAGLTRMLDDEARARRGSRGPVLKVAIVGLGKMGLFHAALLGTIPGARLVAAAEANARLAGPARSMGLAIPIVRSVDSLLDARRADAVIVCTPTVTHYPIVRACLERGVHVLVEKPLAEDAGRAEDLARRAAASGLVHAVGYHLASSPLFERLRGLLADGLLGRLTGYRAWLRHGEVLGPKTGWMFDRAQAGGGFVRNTGSHLIFLLEWLFGTPARVDARTTAIHSRDIEDALTATFEYDGGVAGRIEASWSVPGTPVMEVELELHGERGGARIAGSDLVLDLGAPAAGFPAGRSRIHASDVLQEGVFDLAPEAAGAAYFRQDQAFVEACLAGAPTRTPFDRAARAERAIDAIYRSAERRAPVPVLG
jgi:predicted dehydrogenase/nucleoside-diphosphate-sugar epimerase